MLRGGEQNEQYLDSINETVDMPQDLPIALGLVKGMSNVIIPGYTQISTLERTIAKGLSGGERLTFNRTAQTLAIASTDANDTLAGTGARTVLIIGISTTGTQILFMLNLNGQTKMTLSNDLQCVNRVIVTSAGTSNMNEGTLWIGEDSDDFTAGKPDNNLWNVVGVGDAVSNAIWNMTPLNRNSFSTNVNLLSDSVTKNDGVVIKNYAYLPSGVRVLGQVFNLVNSIEINFQNAPVGPGGLVTEYTGITSTGTINVSGIVQHINIDPRIFPVTIPILIP